LRGRSPKAGFRPFGNYFVQAECGRCQTAEPENG
jgi:hypothetical protein